MSEPFDYQVDAMIFYAFRYCLGRETYVVEQCADYLLAHWNQLRESTRALIKNDIEAALRANRYGSEMDRAEWAKVLDLQ